MFPTKRIFSLKENNLYNKIRKEVKECEPIKCVKCNSGKYGNSEGAWNGSPSIYYGWCNVIHSSHK